MEENISGKVVIDASFLLSFLVPSEKDSFVEEIFELYKLGKVDFVSTYLLPFEVLNGLRSNVLKSKIKKDKIRKLARSFLALDIEFLEVNKEKTLNLAIKEDLSVYDAGYLWLARELKIPLLTLDKDIKGK